LGKTEQEAGMQGAVVLCIDDDLDGLLERKWLLERNGYNVLISTSSRQGLKLLKAHAIDAVILGSRVTDVGAEAVTARMRRLKPRVPLIMVAAGEPPREEAARQVDVVFSSSEPPHKLVDVVQESVASQTPFFSRWLLQWKRRTKA